VILWASTALSTQLDPEELREIVPPYQQTCAEMIQRYEGTLPNIWVMAYSSILATPSLMKTTPGARFERGWKSSWRSKSRFPLPARRGTG